ncbi:hypothetical protein BOH78_3596 [Pichia kudriavzevii]|uniref:Uncharacterized protein n=1 Tax=Pichia kudriavzevii TaxID=4909 RepID=A0A099NP33_PICKU|nr:hypothetical protein JL09_g6583 [Pichia kudriavzevii]ONH70631.1 hypothetical protein BOH78_5093 [Pichia kudriavzevii]ONH72048.1 hypothetical protein BOH78_4066 [Pichia kudriavzevii]ONH72870.1 hypothetical protein BOH78_3596 [Pichia kudriavzevii]
MFLFATENLNGKTDNPEQTASLIYSIKSQIK